MYKLKIKGLIKPVIFTVLGVLSSFGASFIPVAELNLAIPFLVIIVLSASLILNLILFSKASALQTVLLSIFNLLFFSGISSIVLAGLYFPGLKKYVFTHDASVIFNPVTITLSFVFGVVALFTLVKLESPKIAKKTPVGTKTKKKQAQPKAEQNISVIAPVEAKTDPVKVEEPVAQVQPVAEIKAAEAPNTYEKIFQEEIQVVQETATVTEEAFFEGALKEIQQDNLSELPEADEEIIVEKLESPYDKPEFAPNMYASPVEEPDVKPLESLGDLPEINFADNQAAAISAQPVAERVEEPIIQPKTVEIEDDGEYFYIPENIRLVENPVPKNVENTGKITSISKLLINNRDIENIIEANELNQNAENDSEDHNIISVELGQKLNSKLREIQEHYPQIFDLIISNKAGFAISSIIEDTNKEKNIGALSSNAFYTMQNYLTRININNPVKIFFETDEEIYSISKTDNFILFFACDTFFEPVSHTLLKDLLEQNVISNQDFSVVKNIKGVVESCFTDDAGNLLGSINCDNPQKLASISSAVFENLKVYIMNIRPVKLNKIVVFAEDKVIVIKKYSDKIATFVTVGDGPVKLSENSQNIEKIMGGNTT